MRFATAACIAAAACLIVDPARAGDQPPPDASSGAPASAPPSDTDSSANNPCVEVEIGGDRSAYYDCLNKQMEHGVEQQKTIPEPQAPINAQSPSNQVGTANDAAAREKMGTSFGKSAVPERPHPIFVNPIIPGSH